MKPLILGLLGVSIIATAFAPQAWAVKTAIEASGNVQMNGALKSYQDNVLQSITKECLAQKAAQDTVVSLTVDAHGNIMKIVLSNSKLSSPEIVSLITSLKALKLGDAGAAQSDTLRITMDFDLAEVLAGAKPTGTSISIKGGSITGDGTATGGIIIGGGGAITAGGGPIALQTQMSGSDIMASRLAAEKASTLNRLSLLEQAPQSNLQGLCEARLAAVQPCWREGDFTKGRELLGLALKYLEGPAGPLSRKTSRDLLNIAQLLLTNQTASDDDLLWRVLATIEKKTTGGMSASDCARLLRPNINGAGSNSGDKIVSLMSRLEELREMREGSNSPQLIPLLSSLVTIDESMQRHDAAMLVQKRIAEIQKLNGIEPPVPVFQGSGSGHKL